MVSNWLLYDDFVDLVRNHHHDAFSGLITGVTDTNHSFQIGFDRGQIVLMTYRIKKGQAALQLISQIERAKITEHPNRDTQTMSGDVPDTSRVLSQLTAQTLDENTTSDDITEVPAPAETTRSVGLKAIDSRLKKRIESAAIHHFGPIGAMVCEERLAHPDGDIRAVMLGIAQDVGASDKDTQAFFQSVSNG